MDENLELLEYIYKNAEMGAYSCEKLLQDLKTCENKIKKVCEDILKEYEKYRLESKTLFKKNKYDLKKSSIMDKVMSSIGMKMEVNKDNSDAAMAHLLTQGLTMGVVDISSKIDRYEKSADSKILKLAKRYLKFQQESINILKSYL